MPSTLIELMLRSPDSSNLAKASLWEKTKDGRLTTGRLPSIKADKVSSPGVGPILCACDLGGLQGSYNTSQAELCTPPPPNFYVEALNPGTSECDYIGRQGSLKQ